jgi:solute carrier family 25 S-adenosylmethionine transporter 26
MQERPCTSVEAAACGSVAGGIAGAVTTPLDVAKTRIMLAKVCHEMPLVGGFVSGRPCGLLG